MPRLDTGNTPFVPADGVTSIALCEQVSHSWAAVTGEVEGQELLGPRVLISGTDQVVRALDALPPMPTAGPCPAVGTVADLSLVLHYRQGPQAVVVVSPTCQYAWSGGALPRLGSALDTFIQLYRAQLVASLSQATIPTPTCPAAPPTPQLVPRAGDIGYLRISTDPLLPLPIATVAACRYRPQQGGLRLSASHQERNDLAGLAALGDALNV